jgi:hypothetical protein
MRETFPWLDASLWLRTGRWRDGPRQESEINDDRGRMPTDQWKAKSRKALITTGHVGECEVAYVYVGITSDGLIKVGMTSNLDQRAAKLKIRIVHSIPVRPPAAKEVETETLQILGHEQWDGEYLLGDVNEVIVAANKAVGIIRRRMWVDPGMSEEEARKLRITLALDEQAQAATAATPDRSRRISITQYRKAAGCFGAHGGRF